MREIYADIFGHDTAAEPNATEYPFAILLQAVLAILDRRSGQEFGLGKGRQHSLMASSSYPDRDHFICLGHEACIGIATCEYTRNAQI